MIDPRAKEGWTLSEAAEAPYPPLRGDFPTAVGKLLATATFLASPPQWVRAPGKQSSGHEAASFSLPVLPKAKLPTVQIEDLKRGTLPARTGRLGPGEGDRLRWWGSPDIP